MDLGNCSFVLLVPQMLWCILIWVCQQCVFFDTYKDTPPKKNKTSQPSSMGSTLRTKSNPLGRADSQKVKDGNLLCSRALILMLIAAAKGVFWCLEQPSSSTMEYHPSSKCCSNCWWWEGLSSRCRNLVGPPPNEPSYIVVTWRTWPSTFRKVWGCTGVGFFKKGPPKKIKEPFSK